MDKQKLEYFRNLLLARRRQAVEDLRADKATALEGDDGVEDAGEMSELDLNRSTALTLASHQSQIIEEIDEALGRIEDGTYGECSRCGKPLDEERLKAMPTAKYDAECHRSNRNTSLAHQALPPSMRQGAQCAAGGIRG